MLSKREAALLALDTFLLECGDELKNKDSLSMPDLYEIYFRVWREMRVTIKEDERGEYDKI